jgi:hypothetical protein
VRENPVIQCKKPGCDKTFTKYYVNKNGCVKWSQTREYCHGHFPRSALTRKKMSRVMIGKKASPETIRKLQLASIGRWHGSKNPMFGIHRYGADSPNWHGDNIGYGALHRRVRRHLPEPEDGMCEVCHEVPLKELACITGIYNLYLENWKYTCHSCNIKSDYVNGRIKPRAPMIGRKLYNIFNVRNVKTTCR